MLRRVATPSRWLWKGIQVALAREYLWCHLKGTCMCRLYLGSCGVLSVLGHEAYALAGCSTRLPASVL